MSSCNSAQTYQNTNGGGDSQLSHKENSYSENSHRNVDKLPNFSKSRNTSTNTQNNKTSSYIARDPVSAGAFNATDTNNTALLGLSADSVTIETVQFPHGPDYVEVYVSAIADPDHLWVQLIGGMAVRLDELSANMTSFYTSTGKVQLSYEYYTYIYHYVIIIIM